MQVIERARAAGVRTLSEDDSRSVLAEYGIPLVESRRVSSLAQARAKAKELGFPVALKGIGAALAHKTESGVVQLDLRTPAEVERAYRSIAERAAGRLEGVLVQRMVRSGRAFIAGMKRDPQFGPCVMFGLGGIYAEALDDVVFRVAPLDPGVALQMLSDLKASALLGPIRGEPAADRDALGRMLIGLGRIGVENPAIAEIDINPVLLDGTSPVAVDALVVLT